MRNTHSNPARQSDTEVNLESNSKSASISIPYWLNLPILVPPYKSANNRSNSFSGSVEGGLGGLQNKASHTTSNNDRLNTAKSFKTPKISRLSSRKNQLPQLDSLQKILKDAKNGVVDTSIQKEISSAKDARYLSNNWTRGVSVGQMHSRTRLKDKLWKDVNKFGLWQLHDPAGLYSVPHTAINENNNFVDDTVDCIMKQWDLSAKSIDSTSTDVQIQNVVLSLEETRAPKSYIHESMENSGQIHNSSAYDTLYASDQEEETEDLVNVMDNAEAEALIGISNCKIIGVPGLRRRKRLKELQKFVEKQFRRRLFKHWDSIEYGFTIAGDMTISQLLNFLSKSDAKLNATELTTVERILKQELLDINSEQFKTKTEHRELENDEEISVLMNQSDNITQLNMTISYETFRSIFYPSEENELNTWIKEQALEEQQLKQEQFIYEKELAVLEERMKKRLAESAKEMIRTVQGFRYKDPDLRPWDNDNDRLSLRKDLLKVLYTQGYRIKNSSSKYHNPSEHQSDDRKREDLTKEASIPKKISIIQIRSLMLQKYARSGHYETMSTDTAAYIFHDIAADIIKRSIAVYIKAKTTFLWPERLLLFAFRQQKEVFLAWKRVYEQAQSLRRYALRQFVAWKYLVMTIKRANNLFRLCFWPIHVWKRIVQNRLIARDTALFLKDVFYTYEQIRFLHHWKRTVTRIQYCQHQIKVMTDRRKFRTTRMIWNHWLEYLSERIELHRRWKKEGRALLQYHKMYTSKEIFVAWRYYSILMVDLRRRAYRYSLSILQSKNASQMHRAMSNHFSTDININSSDSKPVDTARYSARSTASNDPGTTYMAGILGSPKQSDYVTLDEMKNIGQNSEHCPSDDLSIQRLQSNYGLNQTKILSSDSEGAYKFSSPLHPLTRLTDIRFSVMIKHKSRLHELCAHLYQLVREKDQYNMMCNFFLLQKFASMFFKTMREIILRSQKSRFANDLGAFRVLLHAYKRWETYLRILHSESKKSADDNVECELVDENPPAHSWILDNEWRMEGLKLIPIEAEELNQSLLKLKQDDKEREERVYELSQILRDYQYQEEIIMKREANLTLTIRSKQLQRVQMLIRTRAQIMHDAMDHVFTIMQERKQLYLQKSTFRGIRVIVMMKYTQVLLNRCRLRNWVRICIRFIYLQRHIGQWYIAKVKFTVFQTLLSNCVWNWQHQSPGLIIKLKRHRELIYKYEKFLRKYGSFFDEAPRLVLTKHSPANSFEGVFLRWVQLTQIEAGNRAMIKLFRRRTSLWMLYATFIALKTRIKINYTLNYRRKHLPFLLRQVNADLKAYQIRMVFAYQHLPSVKFKTKLKIQYEKVRAQATETPLLLQQFFNAHEIEIRGRLALEQRLMYEAYNDRKNHHYSERFTYLYGSRIGSSFSYDVALPYSSIIEVVVYCGKTVEGISLTRKTTAGITTESPIHGNPFGTREAFVIVPPDTLVGIELYASQTIYGIKFHTNSGRVSRLFGTGEKGSHIDLHAEKLLYGKEELVGFFGHADTSSVFALGAVFRHTTVKNIFEGLWLQTEYRRPTKYQAYPIDLIPASKPLKSITSNSITSIPESKDKGMSSLNAAYLGKIRELKASIDVPLSDHQFAYFLQVRVCDILSAMKRAHKLAIRLSRLAFLESVLTKTNIVMGLTRWLFNALTRGLVKMTNNEEEGRARLQEGIKRSAEGEEAFTKGSQLVDEVSKFRDDKGQLNLATLGVLKVKALEEQMALGLKMVEQGQALIAEGKRKIREGRMIMPHIPMTKSMLKTVRRIYKIVQTKDYVDQIDPALKDILMENQSEEIVKF